MPSPWRSSSPPSGLPAEEWLGELDDGAVTDGDEGAALSVGHHLLVEQRCAEHVAVQAGGCGEVAHDDDDVRGAEDAEWVLGQRAVDQPGSKRGSAM